MQAQGWLVLLGVISLTYAQLKCPPLPPHTPQNVSDLHPNDIKVIMTLGDSITAGFGIMGSSGLLNEYRGESWAIGGDNGSITIANFLKTYTPDLEGQSLGHHLVEVCYGPLCPPFEYHPLMDVLNAAQSGAMIEDLVDHEYDYLFKQLTSNPNINIATDWKLLTILIGANDLCASCTFAKPFLDPDEYETHLTDLLTKVHQNIPRLFVQIVEMFNISQVYNLSQTSPRCADIHRDLFIECDCLFKKENEAVRIAMDVTAQLYNQRSISVAQKFQALNDPQFTVVTQPFGRDTMIATMPIDFLSSLDCFHPSLYAHSIMAVGLWNNMLTPAAQKKTSANINDTPMCPTADTLIYAW